MTDLMQTIADTTTTLQAPIMIGLSIITLTIAYYWRKYQDQL